METFSVANIQTPACCVINLTNGSVDLNMTTSPWHKVGHTQRSKNVQSYEALKSSAGLHELKKALSKTTICAVHVKNSYCCFMMQMLTLFTDPWNISSG